MTPKQRDAIVKEALSWIGTPYRGWSCVKGVGVDCGQLLYGVYRGVGLLPELDLPKDYSLDVARHQVSREYMDIIDRYFSPVDVPQPGDLACYRLGLSMAHAGIVIRWPDFVLHAEYRHGVSGTHGTDNPGLRANRYGRNVVTEFRTLKDSLCQ